MNATYLTNNVLHHTHPRSTTLEHSHGQLTSDGGRGHGQPPICLCWEAVVWGSRGLCVCGRNLPTRWTVTLSVSARSCWPQLLASMHRSRSASRGGQVSSRWVSRGMPDSAHAPVGKRWACLCPCPCCGGGDAAAVAAPAGLALLLPGAAVAAAPTTTAAHLPREALDAGPAAAADAPWHCCRDGKGLLPWAAAAGCGCPRTVCHLHLLPSLSRCSWRRPTPAACSTLALVSARRVMPRGRCSVAMMSLEWWCAAAGGGESCSSSSCYHTWHISYMIYHLHDG